MELEEHGTTLEQDENGAALAVGGLRSQKRTKSAYARVDGEGGKEGGTTEAGSDAGSGRAPSASAPRRQRASTRERGAVGEVRAVPDERGVPEEWDEFGDEGVVEDELDYEEYDGDDQIDGYGRRRRRGSSIAVVLLVLFVLFAVVGVAGLFATQRFSREEPQATPGSPGDGEGAQQPGYSPGSDSERAGVEGAGGPDSSGDPVEETGLTVSQENGGGEGLYVSIGDETWRGEMTPEEGTGGEVLALDGPTAANVKMGFRTRDPEAIVDHGSFGVYAPGGGLVYATVQRTKAFGAEEAETRGTYTVIGTSGEYYSGTYADSLPEPGAPSAGDRVVRTYTVEEGLPKEAGSEPEEGADRPEPQTFRVAYELEGLEGENGRPIVPQLLGWHAPDGTKLEEIVDAPR